VNGIDIYKRTAIGLPTDEHLVPNALGGTRTARNLIDRATNSVFGQTIDAALAREMLPFHLMLDARRGDGRPLPDLKGLRGADGELYDLASGGVPKVQSRLEVTQVDEDNFRFIGNVPTVAEAKRLAKRRLRALGHSPDALDPFLTRVRSPAPFLQISACWDQEVLRAIAKIGCNVLASSIGAAFLGAEFDEIRNYVLNGGDVTLCRPAALPLLSPNIFAEPVALGPVDHLVIARVRESGSVEARVILYAALEFSMRLGTTLALGSGFWTTLRVDPLTGLSRLDSPDDLVDFPPDQADAAARADLTSNIQRSLSSLLERCHAAMTRRWCRKVIQDAWERVVGRSESLSQEQLNEFLEQVGAEYAARFLHPPNGEDGGKTR
jgi:hypothetical protein